jgi:hypothetical protein
MGPMAKQPPLAVFFGCILDLSVLLFLLCYFFVLSRNPSMHLMSRSLSELKYLYLHAI